MGERNAAHACDNAGFLVPTVNPGNGRNDRNWFRHPCQGARAVLAAGGRGTRMLNGAERAGLRDVCLDKLLPPRAGIWAP